MYAKMEGAILEQRLFQRGLGVLLRLQVFNWQYNPQYVPKDTKRWQKALPIDVFLATVMSFWRWNKVVSKSIKPLLNS